MPTCRSLSTRCVVGIATILVAALPASTVAKMVAGGPEFVPFEGTVYGLLACSKTNGGYVAAYWVPGAPDVVAVQLFDPEGTPVGSAIRVAEESDAHSVDLVCEESGGFLISWNVNTATYGQRYDAVGTPLGNEISFGATQNKTRVAESLGTLISATDTVSRTITFRRFDAQGIPLGSDTATDLTGPDYPGPLEIVPEIAGGFVIAYGAAAQRFDATGTAVADPLPFDLGSGTGTPHYRTGACRLNSGNIVMVGSALGTYSYARLFGPDLQPLNDAFRIDSDAVGFTFPTKVVCTGDGFFVLLSVQDDDGQGGGLFARRFDSAAVPVGTRFRATEDKRGDQGWESAVACTEAACLFARLDHVTYASSSENLLRTRFYCDDTDPGCVYTCPGSSNDQDGDGVPDGCDPCTNVGGAQSITSKARLSLKRTLATIPSYNPPEGTRFSAMKFSGEFALPQTFAGFFAVDPLSQPLRVRVEGADHGTIIDSTLATAPFGGVGTAGWYRKKAGAIWEYRDKQEFRREGIVRVRLKDRSGPDGNHVQLLVSAKGQPHSLSVAFPFVSNDLPPRGIVVFGDQTAAEAGACAETIFMPVACRYGEAGFRTLACR